MLARAWGSHSYVNLGEHDDPTGMLNSVGMFPWFCPGGIHDGTSNLERNRLEVGPCRHGSKTQQASLSLHGQPATIMSIHEHS